MDCCDVKKKKKRTCNFSAEEKRALLAEVKSWPRIWNTADGLHSNKYAIDQAWANISESLKRPATECKAVWISLRESYRYRAKTAEKAKSGSAGGEMVSEPSFSAEIDWEFAEDMSFLPDVSQKRRTYTTMNLVEETSISTPTDLDSQYEYTPTPSKTSKGRHSERWEKFDSLIETQSNLMKLREAGNSHFKEAFTSFDWLLNQLPKSIADEACLGFTQTLLEKIAEEKRKVLDAPKT